MRNCIFYSSDQIAVLNFLAKFKDGCKIKKIHTLAAVWCFQFYVTRQAESLLLTYLAGNTVAILTKKYEMLHIYLELVNFFFADIRNQQGDRGSIQQSCNVSPEFPYDRTGLFPCAVEQSSS